jgi:GT2 family glycosyltransferase
MNATPVVSVVVIGRNEGERLKRCLQSVALSKSAVCSLEIIYVDSDSSDDSVKLATAQGATSLVLKGERPSAARGRNLGWRTARGEFVLFLDGDTILDPGFLTAALYAIQNDAVVAVWGHRREIAPQQSVYVRVLDLDWVYAPGDSAFCGGDVLMRRAALEACGGFDDALIAGEEPELCSRLRAAGGVIRHIDAPMTLHDLAITSFGAYWQRARRAGHAYAEVAQRCRNQPGQLWTREVRSNRVRGVLLLAAPLLLIIAIGLQPVVGGLMILIALALVLRSASLTCAKSPDFTTRLLYAIHSHFQHIPILFGQLGFYMDILRGHRRGLIEYKQRGVR